MSVGNQVTKAGLDNQLSVVAVNLRNIMSQVREQQTPVQNMGLAGLEALGYSSAANPANPGGVSDAQYALNLWGYLNSVQQVYYGQLQQGGSGGTGAILFNFDSALSAVWGGS